MMIYYTRLFGQGRCTLESTATTGCIVPWSYRSSGAAVHVAAQAMTLSRGSTLCRIVRERAMREACEGKAGP